MKPPHRGIPTLYRGVQFRSRTEARWAAFFDALGWPWEYEPVDLDGYIPDFILAFYEPMLVEVKADHVGSAEELRPYAKKIDESGWEGEAVIVGAAPIFNEAETVLGLMREVEVGPDDLAFAWDRAILFGCYGCDRPSFHHDGGHWMCRVDGCYDGREHIGPIDAIGKWRRSINGTQWRKPA